MRVHCSARMRLWITNSNNCAFLHFAAYLRPKKFRLQKKKIFTLEDLLVRFEYAVGFLSAVWGEAVLGVFAEGERVVSVAEIFGECEHVRVADWW